MRTARGFFRPALWLILFGLSATVTFGQPVSPRLVIGVPLTQTIPSGFRPSRFGGETFRGGRSQYLAGAGIDTSLPYRLRLGLSVLYQRISYDASVNTRTTGIPVVTIAESSAAADRWQVPALVYYRVDRPLQPLFGTGVNVSVVSRLRGRTEGTRISPLAPPETFVSGPSETLPGRRAIGWTSGAGLKLPAGLIRVLPELRYTLWLKPHTSVSGRYFRQHQLEFIIGLGL